MDLGFSGALGRGEDAGGVADAGGDGAGDGEAGAVPPVASVSVMCRVSAINEFSLAGDDPPAVRWCRRIAVLNKEAPRREAEQTVIELQTDDARLPSRWC